MTPIHDEAGFGSGAGVAEAIDIIRMVYQDMIVGCSTRDHLEEAARILAAPEAPAGEAGPVATVNVNQLGTGMRGMDISPKDWWHSLAIGAHPLFAHPAPDTETLRQEVERLQSHARGMSAAYNKLEERGNATEAALAEANARVERLTGLLFLADEALMSSHGCFPLDRITERDRLLNDACRAIRAVTGENWGERRRRSQSARTALASVASTQPTGKEG